MRRPVGIIVLGVLCVFTGIGNLFSPFSKPGMFGGRIHTGRRAIILHVALSILGGYVGYGMLKPIRHIWHMYIIGACISIAGLGLNLMHESKIWELYLLLGTGSESIPHLVAFTIETHYLFMAIYALTAMYIYLHKQYFWGDNSV